MRDTLQSRLRMPARPPLIEPFSTNDDKVNYEHHG
jgi:hypothetical protein